MSKIFRKLLLTYVLILFICLIILGPVIGISLRNYYKEKLSHELWLSSVLTKYILKEDLIKKDLYNIQNKSKNISKELDLRVTVISSDGAVLGDSYEDPKLMNNHKDRPEVRDALMGRVGRIVRYSDTLKQRMMYVAIPILENANVAGVVRFAIPLTNIKSNISYIYKIIFISSVLGFLIALLMSFFVGNSFVKPIKVMQVVTKKISQGDFRQKINIKSNDELSELAKYLNHMADELDAKIKEITKDKKELEAILSSMIEGVIVIGKDERIILLNAPINKMLDTRAKDAAGMTYWEAIRNEEINSILRETISNRKHMSREIHIIFPVEMFFNVQTSVVFNDAYELLGVIAVFHNITELKKIDKMRKEFTANVSHEFKTPLTAIKGFVETLFSGAMDDKDKAKEFLNIIKTHADRLEYLLNDLLTLSKIESKEITMQKENIRIQDIIEKVVPLYKNKVVEKKQSLNINVPEYIPLVYVDEEKIEQVFSNLLDNAVKFTPQNGTITITAKDEKDSVRIDFKDTGIGISKEHLPRIFERFYTVDKARSRELGGTGLGLSIVKHIIEAHGGKVSVESTPEKGSKFSVYLPH